MHEALTNEIVPHTRANLPKLKQTENSNHAWCRYYEDSCADYANNLQKNDAANTHETVTYEVSSADHSANPPKKYSRKYT
jgi:hypothetical protein